MGQLDRCAPEIDIAVAPDGTDLVVGAIAPAVGQPKKNVIYEITCPK